VKIKSLRTNPVKRRYYEKVPYIKRKDASTGPDSKLGSSTRPKYILQSPPTLPSTYVTSYR
jgi:hypothetical protein